MRTRNAKKRGDAERTVHLYIALSAKCKRFLKKIVARHRASDMRKKIACIGIRFSVTTVVTTIVTTVATTVVTTVATRHGIMTSLHHDSSYGNRMPTHAIFILMSDARCRAPFLRKNRPSWITTTRRSVQRSLAQKSGEPSNDERAFAIIAAIAGMSRVHTRSFRIIGTLQNRVSWAMETRGDDGSGEMQL